MEKFGFCDRFRIPTYDDPAQMQFGVVEIDVGKCTGCSLCAGACPINTIVMVDGKARPKNAPDNECAFCGDCVAICRVGAVSMKSPYRFTKFFKTINRVGISPPRL